MYHNPVLLKESIDGLSIKPNGTYVDVTFGGGGHSREILARLGNGRLLAFDQDEDAIGNSISDPRFTLINSNFRYLIHFLRYHGGLPVDGIIADLGISSHQIDTADRGFSTRYEGDLDMRMGKDIRQTAADVVNTYTEDKLCQVFWQYGEIDNARRLVSLIVENRQQAHIGTISAFKAAISPCTPRHAENKYLAMVFQALRIEVNNELQNLKEMLFQSAGVLAPGGRIAVISYHSLEDRLVKNFLKTGNFEGQLEKDFYGNVKNIFDQITRKPLTPSEAELSENPRSRSAKLRIAEKTA
jgi:16S rRNA (cytosine1402-N4)-methyltransferase